MTAAVLVFLLFVCAVALGLYRLSVHEERRLRVLEAERVLREREAQRQKEFLEAHQEKQKKALRKINQGRRAFFCPEGSVWNPLKKIPVNARCICGSGRKFKSCCKGSLPDVIPEANEPAARKLLEMAQKGIDVSGMLTPNKARSELRPQGPMVPAPTN